MQSICPKGAGIDIIPSIAWVDLMAQSNWYSAFSAHSRGGSATVLDGFVVAKEGDFWGSSNVNKRAFYLVSATVLNLSFDVVLQHER
jgi:hypothetical protein